MAASVDPDLVERMREWRGAIHKRPGARFDCGETAELVASVLSSEEVEIETGVGQTGVVASIRRGDGRHGVGMRADMDALPIQTTLTHDGRSEIGGRHHGCGHDGHTTMLLGAAVALARSGDFNGEAHCIFQPNEEEGLGAQAMIGDGLFERWRIDEVYGLHCTPGMEIGTFAMRPGPMMTFEDDFVVVLGGLGGHSSAPHLSRDPLVAAAEVILGLQTIVSRTLSPVESGVVSVTELITDGSRNLIPSNVVIKGDTRGYKAEVGETIERRLRDLVRGIGTAHGLDSSVEYTYEFAPVINTPAETAASIAAAETVVGREAVDSNCDPGTGSEDFARFLEHRPGCYSSIGNGSTGSNALPLHNPGFEFNDNALRYGAEYWVRLAEQRLAG